MKVNITDVPVSTMSLYCNITISMGIIMVNRMIFAVYISTSIKLTTVKNIL